MDTNYYHLMGLPPLATTSQVKARYKQLAKRYHPDRQGDTRLMSRINQAYSVLSDPRQRYLYNQSLDKPKTQTTTRPVNNVKFSPSAFEPASVNSFTPVKRRSLFKLVLSPVSLLIILAAALAFSSLLKSSSPVPLNTGGAASSNSVGSGNGQPTGNSSAVAADTQSSNTTQSSPSSNQAASGSSTMSSCNPSNTDSESNQANDRHQGSKASLGHKINRTENQMNDLSSQMHQTNNSDESSQQHFAQRYSDLAQKLTAYEAELSGNQTTNDCL